MKRPTVLAWRAFWTAWSIGTGAVVARLVIGIALDG